ncbi:DUF1800 domain-containing protein [Sphingorhabdus sp. EL138]|uniref:DUF1800 domain-containing protein n=1 Tax=Sphingorhabdus sp. EL138 TaxID=2073156 RepID=UPI0025DEEA5F|nr:DUF1800 domain-containing protein [Sphingorhabdus sp. EL138]
MTQAECAALEEAKKADSFPDTFAAPQGTAGEKSSAHFAIPAASLVLAACGGGGTDDNPISSVLAPTVQVAKPATDGEAARFILKASLAATEPEIADIRSVGYVAWLDKQMDIPISQTGVAWLSSRGYDQVTADEFYHRDSLADYMAWNQLITTPDPVRKRLAYALSQFFVVSTNGIEITWRSNAMAAYWDVLNRHALGNFRQLLEDVTLNPAMGVYLSTLDNRKEDTRTGRVPDENYAREVMQLFTIGLNELNNDGTRKTGTTGQPIETYTSSDVSNLARVFTGYSYDYSNLVRTPSVRFPSQLVEPVESVIRPMTSDTTRWSRPQTSSEHSMLEKTFLGTTIPANTDAPTSMKLALDTLFNHPNVGPFFSKQMIQRLVTSNPSAAYVDRVAKIFNNNGAGVRGDLRAVFKAILLDDEATNAAGLTSPTFGKVREPVLRFIQWARNFGATSRTGNWTIANLANPGTSLGQSPLRAPSVFNFYRPGYVPANTAIATNALVAPEFQIVTAVSVAGYINFMASTIGSVNGVNNDVKATYTRELAIVSNTAALLNRLSLLLSGNQLTDTTKATIKAALDATTVTDTSALADKERRVYLATLLVFASPDYLVQK